MSIFETRGITKRFGGLTAVNDLTFTVNKGEIFGIIGPNGSGKTTVFNMISRFFPITAGEIYFNGNRIDTLPAHEICKIGIGRTFQVVKPLRRMTVQENVMAGAFLRGERRAIGRIRKASFPGPSRVERFDPEGAEAPEGEWGSDAGPEVPNRAMGYGPAVMIPLGPGANRCGRWSRWWNGLGER